MIYFAFVTDPHFGTKIILAVMAIFIGLAFAVWIGYKVFQKYLPKLPKWSKILLSIFSVIALVNIVGLVSEYLF